jgi:hypothetical protein
VSGRLLHKVLEQIGYVGVSLAKIQQGVSVAVALQCQGSQPNVNARYRVYFREHSVHFREHSVHFREHSVNFREHSVNFREHSAGLQCQGRQPVDVRYRVLQQAR